ncbi:MAG: mannose-1-phosphate guanylyltransferase [Saprospiraceae bacterium]|nr:mannose-1-phosphate guanylyltransferase [Saprospiraceae bacterium]MBK8296748.1 mannose-1-phosphate guanylyltransferase [Saprospiraceae bacterium]
MAGGIGSRFWPLSRNQKPKQFLDILDSGRSFIQMTYDRLCKIVPPSNIWVVSHVDYENLVYQQLPEINPKQVLLEPSRKNTAPCILYAAKTIAAIDPDAQMFIAPSDHLILNESQFIEDIQHGFEFINKHPNYLMTFGIHAFRPDTGYGYINFDKERGLDQTIYPVNRFVEKPDLKTAESYLESGDYVWNSGMFLWNVQTILNEFKQYAPTLFNLFKDFNQDSDITLLYDQCPSDSIDYAVMEKSPNVQVKTVDFGWTDLGTWGSLYEILEKDEHHNAALAPDYLLNKSSSNLIKDAEGKLIVVHGLDNLLVINTNDVLLICHRKEEQTIKQIVALVETQFGKTKT